MVKNLSDSERGNPLQPYGLLFPISSKGSFICTISQIGTHHDLCYTSRGVLAETRNVYASSHRQDNTYCDLCYTSREIAQWVHHEGSIRRPIAPIADALSRSYISLLQTMDGVNLCVARTSSDMSCKMVGFALMHCFKTVMTERFLFVWVFVVVCFLVLLFFVLFFLYVSFFRSE